MEAIKHFVKGHEDNNEKFLKNKKEKIYAAAISEFDEAMRFFKIDGEISYLIDNLHDVMLNVLKKEGYDELAKKIKDEFNDMDF